jgi:heme exporter protein D
MCQEQEVIEQMGLGRFLWSAIVVVVLVIVLVVVLRILLRLI